MTTKLEVVNHLLQITGERRVVSLETGHPSVLQAIQAVEDYDKDFQAKGWWFNTNRNQKLLPTAGGEILLPSECMSFSITNDVINYNKRKEKLRYVRRGGKVWDTYKNTSVIGAHLYVDIVIRLAIEDLPQVAANYLKHYAGENYYLDDDGDMQKVSKLGQRTALAWHQLKAEELKVMSVNALDAPAARELKYRIGQWSGYNPVYPGGRWYSES